MGYKIFIYSFTVIILYALVYFLLNGLNISLLSANIIDEIDAEEGDTSANVTLSLVISPMTEEVRLAEEERLQKKEQAKQEKLQQNKSINHINNGGNIEVKKTLEIGKIAQNTEQKAEVLSQREESYTVTDSSLKSVSVDSENSEIREVYQQEIDSSPSRSVTMPLVNIHTGGKDLAGDVFMNSAYNPTPKRLVETGRKSE